MRSPTLLLRLASTLVLITLVIELGTLFWSHPLSFIVFATFGGAALAAGLLIYLYWLIFGRTDPAPAEPPTKE
jgi:uncharacterized membrane protein